MIALVAALVALVVIALLFARGLMGDITSGLNKDRAHRAHERELHGEQVARLVADFASERRRRDEDAAAERQAWAAERTILLNRIQDPAATAFTSNVLAMPAVDDVGMEITR